MRVGEFRVSGINCLIGHDEDYGIPPGRFMRIGKIKGVGILVTHQPPYIPELYPNMRDNEPAIIVDPTRVAAVYKVPLSRAGVKFVEAGSSRA